MSFRTNRRLLSVGFVVILSILSILVSACGTRGGGSTSTSGTAPATGTAQGASGSTTSGTTYEMKIGLATAKDAQDEIATIYAAAIEKATNGRIKAKVYNGSQLGDNTQMTQAIQQGTMEGMLQPLGFMAPFVAEAGVLDLPFLFKNYAEQKKVLAGPGFDPIKQAAEKKGFKILVGLPYSEGFRGLFTKFPVTKMEDLKGKKFRIFPAPELTGQFESWGASAVPMALVEVFTALQQGTLDGLDNPPDVTYKMKHHEAATYFTITDHGSLSTVIMVSKVWFDKLPKDLQDAVTKTAQDVLPQAYQAVEKGYQNAMTALKADPKVKITNMPVAELERMRTAVQPVWEKDRKDAAKGPVLKALEDELKKIR